MANGYDRFDGYLPMNCPRCRKQRLAFVLSDAPDVVYVECLSCDANTEDRTLNLRKQEEDARLAYSPAEAAAIIGLGRSTFYAHVLPKLRVVRVGQRVLVPRQSLEDFLKDEPRPARRARAA